MNEVKKTKIQIIDVESATTASEEEIMLGQTLNCTESQKNLQIKCPNCGHLKDASEKCWNCDAPMLGSESTKEE